MPSPASAAPSVISDNYKGAAILTRKLLSLQRPQEDPARNRLFFLGGLATTSATSRRIEAFRDTLTAAGTPLSGDQVITCGYSPKGAMAEIAALLQRLGGLPAGLFINSVTAFEGGAGPFRPSAA